MNEQYRCTSSNCGSNTYSKTFITSTYWADRRSNQFYDAALSTCLPSAGSGLFTTEEKTCADNRCQQLCIDTYGSNCASYTAEVSYSRSYISFCYVFKGECSNSEIAAGTEGFSERNAGIQSYGAVHRENSATTFFCHQYARRRMSEVPIAPENSRGRELALTNDSDDDDLHFKTFIGLQNEFLKHGTYDGQKIHSVKMNAEVPDASNFYGSE